MESRIKNPGALVIAGTHSGAGKTTIATGLMAAFQRRGLKVQGFKVGPDFIDPGFHTAATGRQSRNLDGWMMGREGVLAAFHSAGMDADLCVIEGVMGLFDGLSGDSDSGSTAEIAKWLSAPVVLVIDASAIARSVAALVRGFEDFDPEVNVAAVIANNVAGQSHYRYIESAILKYCRAKPVGYLRTNPQISLPERHLGLITAAESIDELTLTRLAAAVEESVDLDRLFDFSRAATGGDASEEPEPNSPSTSTERSNCSTAGHATRVRIGVARDAAFCFYYQTNLDLLERCGADLVYLSPLRDPLPQGLDGLYFGGGYPEVHASELSANSAAINSVRQFVNDGGPVYAECGGLMYLTLAIVDTAGKIHEMVGVYPTICRMQRQLAAIGYTAVTVNTAPFLDKKLAARGHQFRYSQIDPMPDSIPRCYSIRPGRVDEDASNLETGPEQQEGYLVSNCLASYVHLHFSSCPEFARRWVELCRSRK